jgi:hypothetical protein
MYCFRSLGGRDRGFESHTRYGYLVCVCVYSVCVVLWVGSDLATVWSLVQGVLPSVEWSWNRNQPYAPKWEQEKRISRRLPLEENVTNIMVFQDVMPCSSIRKAPTFRRNVLPLNNYTRHNKRNYPSAHDTWAHRRGHIPKIELNGRKHSSFISNFRATWRWPMFLETSNVHIPVTQKRF